MAEEDRRKRDRKSISVGADGSIGYPYALPITFGAVEENSPLVTDIKGVNKANKSFVLTAATVISNVNILRERIRTDNELGANDPKYRDAYVKFLDNLKNDLEDLVTRVQIGSKAVHVAESEEVQSWFSTHWVVLKKQATRRFCHENIANAEITGSIYIGLGALGALAGYALGNTAIGFGAGMLLGKVVSGDLKPSVLSDKAEAVINEAFQADDDQTVDDVCSSDETSK